MAEDYIVFLENIEICIKSEIIFINQEQSKYYSLLRNTHKFGLYPIGKITVNDYDIEIHFLHYKNKQEANEKWNKRIKRLNFDNLLVKFCDQNMCSIDLIKRFENLPFKNKVMFGAEKYTPNTIFVERSVGKECVLGIHEPFGESKYLNVTKLLNNLKLEDTSL